MKKGGPPSLVHDQQKSLRTRDRENCWKKGGGAHDSCEGRHRRQLRLRKPEQLFANALALINRVEKKKRGGGKGGAFKERKRERDPNPTPRQEEKKKKPGAAARLIARAQEGGKKTIKTPGLIRSKEEAKGVITRERELR